MTATVRRANLVLALMAAIRVAEQREATLGYTRPSAYVAGLQQVLAAVMAGETLYVVD